MIKIPQKNQDKKELLDITKLAKAQAEKELVNFTENHGYMLDQVRAFQENIARIKKSLDFKGMGERLAIPLKQFSHLAENIKSVSHLFQVSVPTDLITSITELESYPIRENFVYTPRFEQSYNRFDTGIAKFYEKIEYKFSKLEKSIEQLSKNQTAWKDSKYAKNIIFDEATSVLKIGNKKIKLQKGGDQYHFLRIIFEDKNELTKEWFYSEIAEKYDREGNFKDKKFYNAAYQVKQKIIRDAGFRDVLITTLHSVRLNPDYLSQT